MAGLSEEDKARIIEEEMFKRRLRAEETSRRSLRLVLVCLIPVALVIVIAMVARFGERTSGGSRTDNTPVAPVTSPPRLDVGSRMEAVTMMQEFVEERLRAPSTADFPWGMGNDVVNRGDGTFSVSSYVDAENALGGTLRQHFDITLRYLGDSQWRLVSLEFR